MTLYSNEIRRFIRGQSWPKGLTYEVVEYPDFLRLRLFRDNINALSGEDKLHLAKLVNETLSAIHKQGIPIYTEVAKGDGRQNDT